LKIGVMYQSAVGAAATAIDIKMMDAWVAYTNNNGGINGHPVQIENQIETGNLGVALQDVQKLVDDGAIAILDKDVGDDAAWVDYIKGKGIPVFANAFPSLAMAKNPQAFSTAVSFAGIGFQIASSALKVGGPKLGILYCVEAPQCAQIVPAVQAAAGPMGVNVAFTSKISSSSPNYTAPCLALKDAGVETVYIASSGSVPLSVAASCHQQGYDPHYIGLDAGFSNAFAKAPGMQNMIGIVSNLPWTVTSVPGAKKMHDAVDQFAPGLFDDANFNEQAVVMWSLAQLIKEAAEAGAVGTTNPMTPQALLDGVYKLHQTDIEGLTPKLTFTQGQTQILQQTCFFWMVPKDSGWDTPYGLTPTCQTPSS
jgi:branched-chain amino acid transport system substrate-binding protein